jgi:hypothetical protein
MKKNVLFGAVVSIISIAILTSCIEDPITPSKKGYANGNLIVCEGSFQTNSGEVSYIGDTTITSLFQTVNKRPLGDIAQSLTIVGDQAFIVVNNSQKIEVVNKETFESIGTIKGLSYPRSITSVDDQTILVTNGNGYGGDYIYVIDVNLLEKVDSIKADFGPEKILVADNKVWVCNSGQYASNKTVSVFDANTYDSLTTIEVGDLPIDMTLDNDGMLWVMCKGRTDYDPVTYAATIISNTKLVKIDVSSYAVSTVIEMDHQLETYSSNVLASSDDGTIYYTDDAVYSVSKGATTGTKLIDGFFYFVDVNPTNGNIWVGNTTDLTQHTVEIYSNDGSMIADYNTAKFPNSVIFQ